MIRKFFSFNLDSEFKHSKRKMERYHWLQDAFHRTVRIDSDTNPATMGIIFQDMVIALSSSTEYENTLVTYFNHIEPNRVRVLPPKILRPDITMFQQTRPYLTESFEFGPVPKPADGQLMINCMCVPCPVVAIGVIEFSDEEVVVFYREEINHNHPYHGNSVYDHEGKFLGLVIGPLVKNPGDVIVLSADTIYQFMNGDSTDFKRGREDGL